MDTEHRTPGDASDGDGDGVASAVPFDPSESASGAAVGNLPGRKLGLVAVVAAVVLLADQASKTWAVSALDDGRTIDLVGSLRFALHFNPGVAFSLGSDQGVGPWVTLLGLVVVAVVALGSTSRTTLGAIAGGLVVGGAFGNLGDRAFRGTDGFLHGKVVDFIDLQWWPVFNIADAGVVCGAIALVIASLRMPE